MQKITSAEDPEFQLVADESEVIKDNQFILSCNKTGISRFEDLLGITPSSSDTLQLRKARVLMKWNDLTPYTYEVFLQKMTALCGTNFESNPDWDKYYLEIITHLDQEGQVEELDNLLSYMIPANIDCRARNQMEYNLKGNAYTASGLAYCSMYNVTDTYRIAWSYNAEAGAAGVGAEASLFGLTDTVKETYLSADWDAGAAGAEGMSEKISVTDTFNGTFGPEAIGETAGAQGFAEKISVTDSSLSSAVAAEGSGYTAGAQGFSDQISVTDTYLGTGYSAGGESGSAGAEGFVEMLSVTDTKLSTSMVSGGTSETAGAQGVTEMISVTDSTKDEIEAESDAYAGTGLSYTEII